MAITKQQLAALIKQAMDDDSDNPDVTPAQARQNQADKLANAIEQYVIGRLVTVTGVTPGSGTAPGTITG